ncbi:MAG: hypothetical protein VX738_04685 [Planctomycetota bacterium]|nr:hypothetical protein [Planctomycetota bacterium]
MIFESHHKHLLPLFLTLLIAYFYTIPSYGQGLFDFERKPIDYHNRPADNLVTALQNQLDRNTAHLDFNRAQGYLPSLLEKLRISSTTQALVYSKSSLQLRRITPTQPRALYFNDQIYLGWVPGGDFIEIIAADATLGSVFYTLRQQDSPKPQFVRDKGQCLQCHAARRTKNVPGPVIRSLFTAASGQPVFNFGTYVSDHTSPFSHRWGGYYVTGTHGAMRHMGNILVDDTQPRNAVDLNAGSNITDLQKFFDSRPYLTNHSDLVALMVLEHQTQMQNLITLARYEELRGTTYDASMNLALERDKEFRSEFTERRIQRASEALVRYMLFANEFSLTNPVKGTTDFTRQFSARGPHDKRGRSLYQLDLQTRLFKYPLSYMIYSPGFLQLPPLTAKKISHRLHQILTTDFTDAELQHLTPEIKIALLDILKSTHPQLTKHW